MTIIDPPKEKKDWQDWEIHRDRSANDDGWYYLVVEPIVDPQQGHIEDVFIAEFVHRAHAELFIQAFEAQKSPEER